MIREYNGDPDEFVRENQELLSRIISQSSDPFVRALALRALIDYGDGPTLEDVEREINRALGRDEEDT